MKHCIYLQDIVKDEMNVRTTGCCADSKHNAYSLFIPSLETKMWSQSNLQFFLLAICISRAIFEVNVMLYICNVFVYYTNVFRLYAAMIFARDIHHTIFISYLFQCIQKL